VLFLCNELHGFLHAELFLLFVSFLSGFAQEELSYFFVETRHCFRR